MPFRGLEQDKVHLFLGMIYTHFDIDNDLISLVLASYEKLLLYFGNFVGFLGERFASSKSSYPGTFFSRSYRTGL